MFGTAPKPIPSALQSNRLVPARETCENCHWPQNFAGVRLRVFSKFAEDEGNTRTETVLLMLIGSNRIAGIHGAHLGPGVHIRYTASDPARQTIPLVEYRNDVTGESRSFAAPDPPGPSAHVPSQFDMQCVDCHNRPTHIYVPPDRAVDQSLLSRRIDASLPYIKQQGVTALTASYANTDQAVQGIATAVHNFYGSKYPQLENTKQLEIRDAITELQRIYRTTTFPEMKIDWKTHPDNIGHFYFAGCFRCHDGQHMSADGKVIRKDCTICHTILTQEEGGTQPTAIAGVPFKHPVDLGDISAANCSDCHTGGVGP